MIDFDLYEQKYSVFKRTICSKEYVSINDIQLEYKGFWENLLSVLTDSLKYGTKYESSLSSLIKELSYCAPTITSYIKITTCQPNLFAKYILHKKTIYYVENTENLDARIIAIRNSVESCLRVLPDDIPSTKEDSLIDSFAASLQLVLADAYSFRNLGRMKLANVETTISDFKDALAMQGYEVFDYSEENKEMFEIRYADIDSANQKRSAIRKYQNKIVVAKGLVYLPINR